MTCTMLARSEFVATTDVMRPHLDKYTNRRDIDQSFRGQRVSNLYVDGTLKVSGHGGDADTCHSVGMLTISSGATGKDVSSDFYTVLRDSGDVHFSRETKGQIIIATTTRGYSGADSAVDHLGEIDYDPATTFLYDATSKKWMDRRFESQHEFMAAIQPWREYVRKDRDDPMWVSADNFDAINFVMNNSGRYGDQVDETMLAVALTMFHNPEH